MEYYRTCDQCGGHRIAPTGEAKRGGGYHLECADCLNEWDDSQWSYGGWHAFYARRTP